MIESINSTGWMNVLTAVLVLVTGAYVYLTWRIAKSNQKMLERAEELHREEMRPTVYAFLEFREQVFVRLIIENKGRSPAYDLRVELSDDFHQFAEAGRPNLRDLTLFKDEIGWFPPGARIALDLAQGFNFDVERDGKNITPSKFSVALTYRSKFDRYEDECVIDLAPYMGTNVPRTEAEQLGKIEAHLAKIASK